MASLEQILAHQHIWQASQSMTRHSTGIPSGYPELDALFPGGGWPVGALTEIFCDQPGIGELRLLTPVLARLSRQSQWQLWITPPWQPYAPALSQAGIALENLVLISNSPTRDSLWAFEQGLRSGACSAVLGWLPRLSNSDLRRLQLAAASTNTLAILFRPGKEAGHPSPATLRIRLDAEAGQPGLSILKRRGGWPVSRLPLSLPMPA